MNSHYNDLNYWNNRYANDEAEITEWLCGYEELKSIFNQNCGHSDEILMLGTGDSEFSVDAYKDGFVRITNVDYSSTVIDKMAKKFADFSTMSWICQDIRTLSCGFAKNSFDVVVEKATLDAMLVDEKDLWRPSVETKQMMKTVLTEVYDVLKDGGIFISITFAQPHFRLPYLIDDSLSWSIDVEKVGENFHHFVYVMKKGRSKNVERLEHFLYPLKSLSQE